MIGFIILIAVVLWFIWTYNSFVRMINRVAEGWSDIEVQLKRRYDLIPNLVSTVKGYATHESSAFEKVTAARTAAMQAGNPKDKAAAENMLTGTLKTLFAVSEAYPDLKANQNFLELQRELSDTENKVQASRRFYNTLVRDLNTHVESVPSNIIAGLFKFSKKEFFDLPDNDAAQSNVEVKF
jgi:LemA protein